MSTSSNHESTAKHTSLTDTDDDGSFKRKASTFRNFITKDGEYPPEANRYHLYICYACPWACRTLMVRAFKGLEDVISVDVVNPIFSEYGWTFAKDDEFPEITGDTINGHKYMRDLYLEQNPEYDGRYTVPVLFDKKTNTIVNNESSEIIRMLNTEFNDLATRNQDVDLYPAKLQAQIDEINDWVYDNINNGVYKCGFATTQKAYDKAFDALFEHLDKVEEILSKNRWLTGDYFTEADLRLFVTIVRFDPVYVQHFKTNLNRIIDYPNLNNWQREVYQLDGFADTVNMEHIKNHYMRSHATINPKGIVARGPRDVLLNLTASHDRAQFGSSEKVSFLTSQE